MNNIDNIINYLEVLKNKYDNLSEDFNDLKENTKNIFLKEKYENLANEYWHIESIISMIRGYIIDNGYDEDIND